MHVAGLADLHLGHRRFDRTAPGGTNQRECDVALAFQRAMADIREQGPDVIAIAGDVFDRVRPPNTAITLAFSEIRRTMEALPNAHMVLVAGNHEIPKAVETGCLLPLCREIPRVHVVWEGPERLELPTGIVWAVPEGFDPPETPEGLLVLHGEITGILPGGTSDRPVHRIAPERLEGWEYVVLGHFHVHAIVRSNAAYCGALEYVSSDPWGELRAQAVRRLPGGGKGYVLVDLEANSLTFRPIGPPRPHYDLEPIDARDLAAAEVDRLIAERLATIELAGAVVRLRVLHVTRQLRHALDHARIREYKATALHCQLEFIRPEEIRSPAARAGRFRKLDDLVEVWLGERQLPPDVDRQAFVEQGLTFLRDAAVVEDPYAEERVAS